MPEMLLPKSRRILTALMTVFLAVFMLVSEPTSARAQEGIDSGFVARSLQANVSGILNTISLKIYCSISNLFSNSCVDLTKATTTDAVDMQPSAQMPAVTSPSVSAPVTTGAQNRTTVIEKIVERVTSPVGITGIGADYVDAQIAKLAAELRSEMRDRTVTVRSGSSNSSSRQVDSIYEDMNESIDEAIAELIILSEDDVVALIASNVSTTTATSSISGLTVGNFASPNISQWTNNSGYITGLGSFDTDDLAEGANLYFTDARARSAISEAVTGLDYSSASGIFSLTSGYSIPLTASTTEWATKVSSQWTTTGSDIYYNGGNVGIGTTTPASTLELASLAPGLRISSTKDSASFATNEALGMLQFYTADASAPRVAASIVHISDFAGSHGSPRGALQFNVSTTGTLSEAMRISSSGSVGIGTNNPGYTLDVNGIANIATQLRLNNSSGTELLFNGASDANIYNNGSGNALYVNTNSGPIYLGTGGSQSQNLTILSSGNVGIGTTNPASSFSRNIQVTGSGSAAMTLDNGVKKYSFGVTGTNSLGFYDETLSSYRLSIDSSGNVGIGTTTPSAKLFITGTAGTGDIFSIASSTNARLLTVTSSGRLGIGTSTPLQPLHVVGDANGMIMMERAGMDPWQWYVGSGGSGTSNDSLGFAAVNNDSHVVFAATTGAAQAWFTTNVSSYNATTLGAWIQGSLQLGSDATTTAEAMFLADGRYKGTGIRTALLRANSGQTANILELQDSSRNVIGGFGPTGNLGVGTTTSSLGATSRSISVAGLTNATISLVGLKDWRITSNSGGSFTYRNETDNVNAFEIKSTGEMGIGMGSSWTATAKLNVSETGAANSQTNVLNLSNLATANIGNEGRLRMQLRDSGGIVDMARIDFGTTDVTAGAGYGFLRFSTNRAGTVAEAMRITGAGNVGIGTTTPGTLLDIGGGGIFRVGGSASPTYPTFGAGFEIAYDTDANAPVSGTQSSGGSGSTIFQSYSRDASTWKDLWFRGLNTRFDSNNGFAMIINSSGNVGIGTTTPAAKLDVYAGDLYFGSSTYNTTIKIADITAGNTLTGGSLTISAGSATLGSNMSGGNLILQAGNSRTGGTHASGDLRLYAGANNFVSGGVFGDIEFYTGALNGTHTQAMTLSGTTGYFGIGTSTPVAKLAITGTSGTGDVFVVASSTNARLFTVTSSGRVGIGTSTPDRSLVVTGPSFSVADFKTTATSDRSTSISITNNNPSADSWDIAVGGSGNGLSLANGELYMGANNRDFVIRNKAFGGESLRVTGAGNVGIGTSTPGGKLDISAGGVSGGGLLKFSDQPAAINDLISVVRNNGSAGWKVQAAGGSQEIFRIADSGNTARFVMGAAAGGTGYFNVGNFGFGTTTPIASLSVTGVAGTTDVLVLASSTNARLLTLTSSGQLGLGVTPSYALDVRGAGTRLSDATGNERFSVDVAGAGVVRFGANGGYTTVSGGVSGNPARFNIGSLTTSGIPLALSGISGQTGDLLRVDTNGSTGAQFVVKSDGKVGVGTTTPETLLHLSGSSATPFLIERTTADSNINIQYRNQTGSWYAGQAANGNFAFRYNDANLNGAEVHITQAGSLGIGTTTPARKLHVYTSADEAPVRFQDASGYCEIDPTSTSWSCTSDERLKGNIADMDSVSVLERMSQLRPVNFTWKNDENDTRRTGLIAQEVERIFPELVNTDERGYKSVSYGGFTVYLISAFQELAKKVETIAAWFGENTFNVNGDVCVDDVCVSKEEFKNLLKNGANVHEAVGGNEEDGGDEGEDGPPDSEGDDAAEGSGDGSSESSDGSGGTSGDAGTGSQTEDPVTDGSEGDTGGTSTDSDSVEGGDSSDEGPADSGSSAGGSENAGGGEPSSSGDSGSSGDSSGGDSSSSGGDSDGSSDAGGTDSSGA